MKKYLAMLAVGIATMAGGHSSAQNSDGLPQREAGNWKTDIALVEVAASGMNEKTREGLRLMTEGASGAEVCWSAEQAAYEDFSASLDTAAGESAQCTWSKREVLDGRFYAAGTCMERGQSTELAISGTREAKRMEIEIISKASTPRGTMSMTTRYISTHIGACKAD